MIYIAFSSDYKTKNTIIGFLFIFMFVFYDLLEAFRFLKMSYVAVSCTVLHRSHTCLLVVPLIALFRTPHRTYNVQSWRQGGS